MKLTKSTYQWVKERSFARAVDLSGVNLEDQDDIAEEWGNWRDGIIDNWGNDVSPRQVDVLADYAMRWAPRYIDEIGKNPANQEK